MSETTVFAVCVAWLLLTAYGYLSFLDAVGRSSHSLVVPVTGSRTVAVIFGADRSTATSDFFATFASEFPQTTTIGTIGNGFSNATTSYLEFLYLQKKQQQKQHMNATAAASTPPISTLSSLPFHKEAPIVCTATHSPLLIASDEAVSTVMSAAEYFNISHLILFNFVESNGVDLFVQSLRLVRAFEKVPSMSSVDIRLIYIDADSYISRLTQYATNKTTIRVWPYTYNPTRIIAAALAPAPRPSSSFA